MGALYSAYTNAMLASSDFVTGIEPISCNSYNCTSVFLSGGILQARRLDVNAERGLANSTFLDGTLLDNADAILVNNAPGYHLEFSPPGDDFTFGQDDCATFGQKRGDGLFLCIGSSNSDLVAGH